MTIQEIHKNGKISVRSYNLCVDNEIYSVQDLKNYYQKHWDFRNLRNCGLKSNKELIDVCTSPEYAEFYEEIPESVKAGWNEIIPKLSRLQREVINSFIVINWTGLSIRSKNGIERYLSGNLNLKQFADKIFSLPNFDLKNIKNIGGRSIPELEAYILEVKEFILSVIDIEDENELFSLKNRYLIQRIYSISEVPDKILESESIFQLTNFLLDQNALFDRKQTFILTRAHKIYQRNEELSLEEIANKIGLTRERVRQIRVKCFNDLFQKLTFLQNFKDDLFQKYSLDTTADVMEVNDNIKEIINKTNNTDFTRYFITYILYCYLPDSYSIIGNPEDVLFPKTFNTRNKHNWIDFYLVKNEIASEYNFETFIDDLETRLNEKIDKTYSFNFKGYLSRFLTNDNIYILDTIIPIAENIIRIEFGINIDLEDQLTFKKNTYKQTYEYAYEALEELGKQSKVSEIFAKVKELYPFYESDEEKLRVSMIKQNGFVPLGRQSLYGLKKWEHELTDFKGGTIREIAKEYLENCSEPAHISDISSYVLIYRPKSNEYSIHQNLKLDNSGDFIFIKGGGVGLSNKKYTEDFMLLSDNTKSDKRTWEESYAKLSDFILHNRRLPYATNCPEDEQILYRWLNVQKVRIKKEILDHKKVILINKILEQYANSSRPRRKKSTERYKELYNFVKTNSRKPIASREGEQNLYHFFNKQRKLLSINELGDEEKAMLIEILKHLQNLNNENKGN